MRFMCTVLLACLAASLTSLRESSALPASPARTSADGLNHLDDSTIIVPVARNFSSLKELFQILHEDTPKYAGPGANVLTGKDLDLARVNESLVKDDSYVIFITD